MAECSPNDSPGPAQKPSLSLQLSPLNVPVAVAHLVISTVRDETTTNAVDVAGAVPRRHLRMTDHQQESTHRGTHQQGTHDRLGLPR